MPSSSSRPSVTDDHLKKYDEIMKTSLPNASSAPQKKDSFLSSIPKPKGIGSKIFIFTGGKKIVMDDGEKEVEKAKIITPTQMKDTPKEKIRESKKPTDDKKDTDKKPDVTENKKKEKKSSSKGVIIFGVIALLIIWTAAWAYFLGLFSLLGS